MDNPDLCTHTPAHKYFMQILLSTNCHVAADAVYDAVDELERKTAGYSRRENCVMEWFVTELQGLRGEAWVAKMHNTRTDMCKNRRSCKNKCIALIKNRPADPAPRVNNWSWQTHMGNRKAMAVRCFHSASSRMRQTASVFCGICSQKNYYGPDLFIGMVHVMMGRE